VAYLNRRHIVFVDRSLSDNVRQVILAPGSMWLAEPTLLLYDEVREPATHLAILKAIGAGNHTLAEISNSALVSKAHLSAYLARLQELRLVERRLPVTIPPARRRRARSGRYHLSDPYFRFLAPNQDELTYHPDRVLPRIRDGLRAFVGMTAFEELSRLWVSEQGRAGKLPLAVQEVGSHWSREVQACTERSERVDVVALNWRDRAILLGECKWGSSLAERSVVRELLGKASKVAPADDWQVHYALFARAGFTAAARAEANDAILVDLATLDQDLRRALEVG
jgi:AAA+ ATPase superfamily predicted ATPase